MDVDFPFLTVYDPPGTSEGTLDPLGLYQIADQLAVQLVPAVRERMQRIRFLTAMAVGTFVTDGIVSPENQRDVSPFLVWEWLIVEAILRSKETDKEATRSVPGILMAKRALSQHGYLDARSYLKVPRIYGFHGVYKRLAVHLGLIDIHLGPDNIEVLVLAWAKGLGFSNLSDIEPLIGKWREAIKRSCEEKPCRTKPNGWTNEDWSELANAFAPNSAKTREKRCIQDLLLDRNNRQMGALPLIWELQKQFTDDIYTEEKLHKIMVKNNPNYAPLINAIQAYEIFSRGLQDAFDTLKSAAAEKDIQYFEVTSAADIPDFNESINNLQDKYTATYKLLGEIPKNGISLQVSFDKRFGVFASPMSPSEYAIQICAHHEKVQKEKSAEGKRPWFDRIDQNKIFIRPAFREPKRDLMPGKYVHEYRGKPIRHFWADLT